MCGTRGARRVKLAKRVKGQKRVKVTLPIGTNFCRPAEPTMQAKMLPSSHFVSTDAGSEDTSDDLDMLCDLFCAPPTLALSARGACVLGTGTLTGSVCALADNRSWPPREPQAKPQVACSLQTSAVNLLRDQRPRLPRYRRKVR